MVSHSPMASWSASQALVILPGMAMRFPRSQSRTSPKRGLSLRPVRFGATSIGP